jgi:hypothetical protein
MLSRRVQSFIPPEPRYGSSPLQPDQGIPRQRGELKPFNMDAV